MLHTKFSLIVWLMISANKGWRISQDQLEFILLYVKDISSSKYHEVITKLETQNIHQYNFLSDEHKFSHLVTHFQNLGIDKNDVDDIIADLACIWLRAQWFK